MMKPLAVIGFSLIIAGCNMPSRDAFVARSDSSAPIQSYVLGQPEAPVPAEAMLLLPPEAGGVLRIRERHFRNGTRQEIVLAGGTSGENILEVSFRTAGGDNAPRGELQIGKPSQRGIATEAQARFQGVRMHVVTRPMSNVFGPFGLAIGRRANGERCVFAWQWIEDLRGSANGSRSPLALMLSGGAMPASVRVRICRANMSLDEMAGLMEGLRPVAPAIDRAVRLDRRLVTSTGFADTAPLGGGVAAGALTAPMGGSLEAALPGPALSAPRAATAPAARAVEVAPAPRVTRSAPARAPVRAPPSYQEPAAHPQPSGPRYLAPVEGAATGSPGPAAATLQLGASRLDPSLPSRAYLGPSGQR
jgi:hypothetical protein